LPSRLRKHAPPEPARLLPGADRASLDGTAAQLGHFSLPVKKKPIELRSMDSRGRLSPHKHTSVL
jgi:hypothetical protein